MTQTELVKIAIDILINGKPKYYLFKVLGNKVLDFTGFGALNYINYKSHREYAINFDKKVKNMAMLCVLLKDWSNKSNCPEAYYNWRKPYEGWHERGLKWETEE